MSVEIGPQFGFMVSNLVKTKSSINNYKDESRIKNNDEFKRFDFAAALGVSYKVFNYLEIAGRYNMGLSNISNTGGDVKSTVFQLGIGAKF